MLGSELTEGIYREGGIHADYDRDLVGRHEKTFHATDMGYGGHGQTQPRQEKTTDTNLKYSEIPQEQFMESGVQGQIINDFEVAGMAAPAYNLHTSMHDQPIHDQSIHDQPIHDQSIHDQSIHDQPIHEGFVYETANTSFNGNENITHTNSEPIHQEFYTAEDCIDPNLGALPQPPQTFAQPTHQDAYHNHTAEDCIDPSLG
jgi:hypothetical protein